MSALAKVGDDDPRIIATTLERMKVGLTIEIAGMAVALAVSPAAKISLPPAVIATNALMLSVALAMFLAVHRGSIRGRAVHPMAALAWACGPITTLITLLATHDQILVFPVIIEIALAGIIQTSWKYVIVSTTVTLLAFVALVVTYGDPDGVVHITSAAGLAVATCLLARGIRRSMGVAAARDDQQVATAALLERELEERRRAEAEREGIRDQFVHAQRMDAVGTLAAGLAHDMNNIIAGILGTAEMAADDATQPNVRDDLLAIAREATRAAELTRSLLAFSRRGKYRKAVVAVESVVSEVEPLLSRMLANRVTLERRGGVDVAIDADAAQLGQAIVNLCINGADAMSGRGTLTLTTSLASVNAAEATRLAIPAANYVTISVRDTGRGMDEAVKKQIFEPFFTTKAVGEGTGLGLAMVYGTVRGHGGAIDVTSAPGKGSTFTLYVPISDRTAVPRTITPRESTRVRLPPRLALVVDDEPVIRGIATRILRQMGLSVVGASDGAEALEVFAARREEISIVMLDMSMPVMSGAECFRELRAKSRVPIVIASGFANESETQTLLSQGNTLFLEKPFSVDQLRAHVERVLARA